MTEGQAPHNELWEQIHQNMDWGLEPDPLLDLFIKQHYPDTSGKIALDIGCGRGANTLLLAEAGFKVIAADVSLTALKKMKELATNAFNIIPILGDITNIHFALNSFDLIVDAVSLSQLPETDIAAVIGKAEDWLKPGGWLFSKLAREPFSRNLVRAPIYPVDEVFIRKAFAGFVYATQPIQTRVRGYFAASYWLVHAKKELK